MNIKAVLSNISDSVGFGVSGYGSDFSQLKARKSGVIGDSKVSFEKEKGIVFSYDEIEDLNERGYLTDFQLLDDNGGDPYGNCVIVLVSQFSGDDLDKLGLDARVEDVYYTRNFNDSYTMPDFSGWWYAKGSTGEALFSDYSDAERLMEVQGES